ncbi:MAG: hypothetical protein IPM97_09860 [Bdellovibrionaceae bacterium]|nr:hypothetical protein [Pseudobdellovibrionaceae bacterium]
MMLRLLLFFLSISNFASATEKVHYQIYLNPELRYERDASQQMSFRQPMGIGFGLLKEKAAFILEGSHDTETSGNQTLSINRTHYRVGFWINYDLFQFGRSGFFAGVGAGPFLETVKTTLNGVSTLDNGEVQPFGGTSMGLRGLVFRRIVLSAEGRLIVGHNFDPNPQIGILFRIGAEL